MLMQLSAKILHWTPRIICILAIIFISLFALDAFNPKLTFWQQIRDFLIHLIPSFILLAILIVSWKHELIGGIIFTLIGLGFSPFLFKHNYVMNNSIGASLTVVLFIASPFVLAGVLFILNHFKKQNNKPQKINKL